MSQWVGAALPRKEDRRMLLGRGRFVGDLTRPGLLHAAFVRSPHAHALVGRHRRRRRPPGTRRARPVHRGRASATRTCSRCWSGTSSCRPRCPSWPATEVRFTGEPVAIVVADDAYRAEDAAELVEVDWDPRPAVASIEAATAAGGAQAA